MSSFDYGDPIIYQLRSGTEEDAYVPFIDLPYRVVNGTVLLQELPVRFNRVSVKDTLTNPGLVYFEIDSGIPTEHEYIVDYSTGIIKFNSAADGKTLAFSGYFRGASYLPASRIWTQVDENGGIVKTLDDAVSSAANFTHRGSYDPSLYYEAFNLVSYRGGTFMSVIPSSGIAPTNTVYWKKITGFQWRGTYAATESYMAGDTVINSTADSVYQSITDNNTNQSLTDESKWVGLVSVKNAIDNVNSVNESIQSTEAARVTAEQGRVGAEQERAVSEDFREAQEATRQSNEGTRDANEQKRKTNEDGRVSAESTRVQTESDRVNAEAARVTAEQGRVDAENDRVTAEDTRSTNEDAREVNETTRQSNESARVTAEETRSTNEDGRVQAESDRATAEQGRVTAESDRESKETIRESNESTRVSNEDGRKTAEDERISAESSRVTAEDARISNETARISVETERATNETTRQNNETDRISKENERETNETTRQTNETNRESAESLRVSNEDTRQSNETTRQEGYTAYMFFEEYDNAHTYHPLNKVAYQGSSYQCIAESTGNLPTDEAYWTLIAAKGLDGTGSGTVTTVSSESGDIVIANPSTTPDISIAPTLKASWNGKQDALGFTPENVANKDMANGYAGLDENGKLSLNESPYVGSGPSAFAANDNVVASGANSFAEGDSTTASGLFSHAEGTQTIASRLASHAEGSGTIASGDISHAEGSNTYAGSTGSHSEGQTTLAMASFTTATVLSYNDKVFEVDRVTGFLVGTGVFVCGVGSDSAPLLISDTISAIDTTNKKITLTNISGSSKTNYIVLSAPATAHAEGLKTMALGVASHVEGNQAISSGLAAHAEGFFTTASSDYSHSEGYLTQTGGDPQTLALYDYQCTVIQDASIPTVLRGANIIDEDVYRLISGLGTVKNGVVYTLHPGPEGRKTYTTNSNITITVNPSSSIVTFDPPISMEAAGDSIAVIYIPQVVLSSHAEGFLTVAGGAASHTEGMMTSSNGAAAHAEGMRTTANGQASHAEGINTLADSHYSHAEGDLSVATNGNAFFNITAYNSTNKTITLDLGYTFLYSIISFSVGEQVQLRVEDVGLVSDTIAAIDSTNQTITLTSNTPTSAYKQLFVHAQLYLESSPAHAEGKQTLAAGLNSHAEGSYTLASGDSSHAEGFRTAAANDYAHAEGGFTKAIGTYSHTEGYYTTAQTEYSHAEGLGTFAGGGINTSKIIGYNVAANTFTLNDVTGFGVGSKVYIRSIFNGNFIADVVSTVNTGLSVITLQITKASANFDWITRYDGTTLGQHSEGVYTIASGYSSHAEGYRNVASGTASHVEGFQNIASGDYSHSEGQSTLASGGNSHAEGYLSTASGSMAHAEGQGTNAAGGMAHAEGFSTQALGNYSHAEGNATKALGQSSHAEGYRSAANGYAGYLTLPSNYASTPYTLTVDTPSNFSVGDTIAITVQGYSYYSSSITAINGSVLTVSIAPSYVVTKNTTAFPIGTRIVNLSRAIGAYAHAEGQETMAMGDAAHAEGWRTVAFAPYSHAEGFGTQALGQYSHAEGYMTTSNNYESHAEGSNTTATGLAAHAEGYLTQASGQYAHTQNNGTIAQGQSQTTIGEYNIAQGTTESKSVSDHAFIIGNGTSDSNRSNALSVDWAGNLIISGDITNGNGVSLNALFQSVSDGKSGIAAAITDKGVGTAATATFEEMETNIRSIKTVYRVTDQTSASTYSVALLVNPYLALQFRGTMVAIEVDIKGDSSQSTALYWVTIDDYPSISSSVQVGTSDITSINGWAITLPDATPRTVVVRLYGFPPE